MDAQRVLAAIGEPSRFRIVELLATGPRTVGEVAAALGALQPQTTKHLQLLEAVGAIRVERLGRRRLASLNRATLGELGDWLQGLATPTADDIVLTGYAAAVADAEERASGGDPIGAEFSLHRSLAASPDAVWRAWTDPALAAQWWAPRHFAVARCAIAPEAGAAVELVLREGDGAEYASTGSVQLVVDGQRLVFELSPVDAAGERLFEVVVDVGLAARADAGTELRVTIAARGASAETAVMLAGLEPGWSQQLDRLEELIAAR